MIRTLSSSPQPELETFTRVRVHIRRLRVRPNEISVPVDHAASNSEMPSPKAFSRIQKDRLRLSPEVATNSPGSGGNVSSSQWVPYMNPSFSSPLGTLCIDHLSSQLHPFGRGIDGHL